MLDSTEFLFPTTFPPVSRGELEILQVNLGYRCNQSCNHCHVNAGPKRTEMMALPVIEQILQVLQRQAIGTLDLTGGAPEMNPHFRYLVAQARRLGVRVIDRCNLTILQEDGYEDLAGFLAEQAVEVVASLPCYLKENVESQRGRGVFDASIQGLRRLNALGYGEPGSGLSLNLVYNPQGVSLPPQQGPLERDYKSRLLEGYGIRFNQLYTITNMPISRFGSMLLSHGQFDEYMTLLKSAHSEQNLATVMCRNLVSVDWQGYLYDCDFNQMLKMPILQSDKRPRHISLLLESSLNGRGIRTGDHCYGCTAGFGSSCGGALSD